MEPTFTLQELETIELAIGVLAEIKADERDFLDDLLGHGSNEVLVRQKKRNDETKRLEQDQFKNLISKVQEQIRYQSPSEDVAGSGSN